MRHFKIILIGLVFLFFGFSSSKVNTSKYPKFKKHFTDFNVQGSFVLYDQKNDKYYYYNKKNCSKLYTPASTYKIYNSLVGLETGVIKDENFIIPWDSVKRQNPNWNTSQDLQTAFKNSTVWYYQELARRVGVNQSKFWLDKLNYGNKDTSGSVDKFWLSGGLRISPMQQLQLLIQLQNDQLPFSKRSIDIVKKIMIEKETDAYTLRSKTGWGFQNNEDIGWYIGYIEANNNVYYFVNCIQTKDSKATNFAKARIEIVYSILKELNIISIE